MKQLLRDTFIRKPQSDTKRIEYLDLAKGICILYVVILHCGVFIPILHTFFLSLFFFISGYFTNVDKDFYPFFKDKAKKILWPFFLFFILGILYFGTEKLLLTAEHKFNPNLDIFHGDPNNGPIWFLLALFWDYVVFWCLNWLLRKDWLVAIVVFSLCAIGITLLDTATNYLKIASSLISLPFFAAGYWFKKYNLLDNKYNTLWIGLIALGLIYAFITFVNFSYISFYDAKIEGNFLLAYLISFMALFGLLFICKRIIWLPFISYVGEFSLIVLCIHLIFINCSAHILQKLISNVQLVNILVITSAIALSWISIGYIKIKK